LLIEIGCEEIPARVVAAASAQLRQRVLTLLDEAGIEHGEGRAWGGARRLAVRIEEVAERTPPREDRIFGPPASAAFAPDGSPTAAGLGFARKHGISPSVLEAVPTEKGLYCSFLRRTEGRPLGEILRDRLPEAVAGMSFPKTMRWAEGVWRWVRPVHWLVVLHGERVLDLELFGVRSGSSSRGHRFLSNGPVAIAHADRYLELLREARVMVDPSERRRVLLRALREAAAAQGGRLVEDEPLLAEVSDLVEWPGVVVGRFEEGFLALPREVLVATLRHHQKAFSVEGEGGLLPVFLAVSNTDGDPAGHIRRGHEWVVRGRLEDARFFWAEDRKHPLASRLQALAGVAFHERAGSYLEKASRMAELAARIAGALGLAPDLRQAAGQAARLAKADLVCGLVGEFPELQGIVGGLLLREEGEPEPVWRAVYEHYRPQGADDPLPTTVTACVVAVADKLDTLATLLACGEAPSGSRDPYGLRRAANGILRILLEARWDVSLKDLVEMAGGGAELVAFFEERAGHFLRDRGFTAHEVRAVFAASTEPLPPWSLTDLLARLEALRTIREREDFHRLVELTRRAENIRAKAPAELLHEIEAHAGADRYEDRAEASSRLEDLFRQLGPEMERASNEKDYIRVVELLAAFTEPVEAFFEQVLVLDPENLQATKSRLDLMGRVHAVLTRYFDLTKLPGEAPRRR